ncbi:PREDICTED: protein FAR1-RELATED SEQUENCE 9-like [Ipomoea nil]|uniref:protein FAR1-RELATED SEQUENCE 9-like n=1 Tax=Ipomoea nil TaxID=35883 RepID=UPI000900E3E6|nr:PREDICTED: protein FAR1-RELATED SEQUENCE 9-like [Ipomoea nil]
MDARPDSIDDANVRNLDADPDSIDDANTRNLHSNPDPMDDAPPGDQHGEGTGTECNLVVLPDGTKQWLPNCNSESTPYVGQEFATLDDGIEFYRAYASIAGFDIRNGTKRQLDIGHKIFVANCARANIGSTKSWRLYKEMVGSFTDIGATSTDFCNFRRDLLAYIAGADAQMVVEDMYKNKEMEPDFYFDFDLNEDRELCRLFWADTISRMNFACFGDVMSFDATYSTNRYKLVFVPFTGVDNHKRSITFGSGLIAREDVESYEWLLKNFKNAKGYAPRCVITDQDPALKIAVPNIMPETRHRFCMWHIMEKVGDKAGIALAKNMEFRKALNNIVWDETLSAPEFELQWAEVMKAYNLVDHRWFEQMYKARESCIPTYFQDIFMGGLLKTTSHSESENSYFGNFTNHHNSLVEFLMQYNRAIGEQRHAQQKLNVEGESSFPATKTPLAIERQAAAMYTKNIFYDFQEEIWDGSFRCRITCETNDNGDRKYSVHVTGEKLFEVTHEEATQKTECNCNKFNRVGILCKHVLAVFKNEGVEEIPSRYIVARWTKNACAQPMYNVVWKAPNTTQGGNELRTIANQLWNEFYKCMGLANGCPDEMDLMLSTMQELKGRLKSARQHTKPNTTAPSVIETILNASAPAEIQIKPPSIAKNKGSGKRLKGNKEKATEKNKKKGEDMRYL